MKTSVELKGMTFHAFHGCLESERKNGNEFVVDLSFEYDYSKAAGNDNLEDAVDYSEVYDMVSREMSRPSSLLESVAFRIASSLFDKFPQIESVTLAVSKNNPPLSGPCRTSSACLSIRRDEI